MERPTRYAPEVRECAVRLTVEHRGEYSSHWAAIDSVTERIRRNRETLRQWMRQEPRGGGQQANEKREQLKALEGRNRGKHRHQGDSRQTGSKVLSRDVRTGVYRGPLRSGRTPVVGNQESACLEGLNPSHSRLR